MRILMATTDSYRPDLFAGSENSTHTLLHGALTRGCDIEAVAVREGASVECDNANQYPTWRATAEQVFDLFLHRLDVFAPDVVVTQLAGGVPIVAASLSQRVPTAFLMRIAMDFSIPDTCLSNPHFLLISNSQFTARWCQEQLKAQSVVVYPPVIQEEYRAQDRDPQYITFINPIRVKGRDIAFEVARLLPHRTFLFVEGWPLTPNGRIDLEVRLEAVPNVIYQPRTMDMKEVYRKAILLMDPSRWEATFGRVLVEATCNGIPVVATRIGGVPEAINEGVIFLDLAASASDWAETIEAILNNPSRLSELSAGALRNAAREELDVSGIVDTFISALREHVEACRGR